MTKPEYEAFLDALLIAEKPRSGVGGRHAYFDGCLPHRVMAVRPQTLRFGPHGFRLAHQPAPPK